MLKPRYRKNQFEGTLLIGTSGEGVSGRDWYVQLRGYYLPPSVFMVARWGVTTKRYIGNNMTEAAKRFKPFVHALKMGLFKWNETTQDYTTNTALYNTMLKFQIHKSLDKETKC